MTKLSKEVELRDSTVYGEITSYTGHTRVVNRLNGRLLSPPSTAGLTIQDCKARVIATIPKPTPLLLSWIT
jgi:hypothetical protein